MKNQHELYVFHIEHPSGEPLILHPFRTDEDIINKLDSVPVKGFYGKEPRVESITLLRTVLYKKIEIAVQNWLKEKRFLKKFLISSAIFLAAYLLFSLVMRDPLPMIDEMVLGLAAALGFYWFQTRRERNSEPALKKRVLLRGRIDAIHFEHNGRVEEIEAFIQEHGKIPRDEIGAYLCEHMLNEPENEIEEQLKTYLSSDAKTKKLKRG